MLVGGVSVNGLCQQGGLFALSVNRHSVILIAYLASFTLQVLMLNSDVLPISDGCLFTRSFNCDPYLIHVYTCHTI